MGKGANKQLMNNAGTAQSNSSGLNASGTALSGYLTPQLEAEANNPQGYTPQQMAYMNTASQQSLGGGASATTGQANLTAARTRNAGGFQGAVGTADRNAQKQISQNALGIQTQQANLQQAQRQQALQSLQQLYGVDESTALGYLNSSNSALNSEEQAPNFFKDFSEFGQGISGLAGAANQATQAYNNAGNGGCWIAAALYGGWDDPRTVDVRRWLNMEFKKTWTGKVVMAAYMSLGREVAWLVERSPLLQNIFRPLFDLALEKARAGASGAVGLRLQVK